MDKMNRGEFLEKLFMLYPDSFSEKNKHVWLEAYKRVLQDPEIDYDKLFKTLLTEYKFKAAPPTSWIWEQAKNCVVKKRNENPRDDWRERYAITRWSHHSIWIRFNEGPCQSQEYECGKEGEFKKACTECLKTKSNDRCDCCHECKSECDKAVPCLMRKLVEEHNRREANYQDNKKLQQKFA